jgi:RNA polymerase subunit RPABC4/transcription elongation factor Spt4
MTQELKWCPHCESKVTPTRKDDSVPLIIALGLLYYPYYFIKRPSQCPICGNTDLESHEGNQQRAGISKQ